MPDRASTLQSFNTHLARAVERRRDLIQSRVTQAIRLFSATADGMDGLFVDQYHHAAVMIVYESRSPKDFDPQSAAQIVLDQLQPLGVRAVYHKPFARDRSRLSGQLPSCVTDPAPLAGAPLPPEILINEYDWRLEIRPYDGLSTGLFLDQRDNRSWVQQWVIKKMNQTRTAPAVLNTFAYTCAFSVAAAQGGGLTTSVDVSGRYLDWGKRNFSHNQIDPSPHRFAKMDTFEFLNYARRKSLKYDLIILDPPSFASANKKKGIRAWSSVDDYARLIRDASDVLKPRGVIFASTNTQELCRPDRLKKEIITGLSRTPRWVDLPPPPVDFSRDQERFSALAFTMS